MSRSKPRGPRSPLPFLVALAIPATTSAAPRLVEAEGAIPASPPHAELEPIRELRAVPSEHAAAGAALTHDPRPVKLGDKILYINFDGQQVNACGNSNPQQNCSTIFGGTVLPYTGDQARRAAIIQTVRTRVEDFGISVTDQRPQSGDYDMEIVGDWQGQNPDFAGIAPAGDCWDQGGGETSFTLEAADTSDGIAEIILQELAHTWGLDHVDDKQDLLFPTTDGINKIFQDRCSQIVSDVDLTPSSGFCSHHAQACGTTSQQNSYQELLMIFGASVPDTTAPTIEILSPAHGDIIDGGAFDVTIGLADDQRPAVIGAVLTFASDALAEPVESSAAYPSPIELKFPVEGLPNGDYDITLRGEDESDNPAEDSITIRIVNSDVPGNDDGADSDDDAADDGTGDNGGKGDDGDDNGDDNGDEGSNDGSNDETGGGLGLPADGGGGGQSCAVAPRRGGSPTQWLWALLALGLRPRRGRGDCCPDSPPPLR